MEGVSQSSLGSDRCQRFLHGRGVDVFRADGFLVLFFMELKTRRVEIGGIASSANGLWMSQIGRNLADAGDGFFAGKRYLIHDRDPLYTKDFLAILTDLGSCP